MGTRVPFVSLFWSSNNNVITNNLKLCLFAFYCSFVIAEKLKNECRVLYDPICCQRVKDPELHETQFIHFVVRSRNVCVLGIKNYT